MSTISSPLPIGVADKIAQNPAYDASEIKPGFDYTYRTSSNMTENLLATAAYRHISLADALKTDPERFVGASCNKAFAELCKQQLYAYQALSATEKGLLYEVDCIHNEKKGWCPPFCVKNHRHCRLRFVQFAGDF